SEKVRHVGGFHFAVLFDRQGAVGRKTVMHKSGSGGGFGKFIHREAAVAVLCVGVQIIQGGG
ncbi:MAG: hypothetical protein K2K47_02175, partial [Duncaniella sp.]|nr:hypothetical protein [Duncaniella sp.]